MDASLMRAAACRGLAPIAYPCIFRGGSGRAVGTTAIGGKGRNEGCFRAAFCARPSAGETQSARVWRFSVGPLGVVPAPPPGALLQLQPRYPSKVGGHWTGRANGAKRIAG